MKYTNAKLDLTTDPDMYLMIENNMRGKIATISHRQAWDNNPLVEGYDPSEPNSYIKYLDASNLYRTAMLEPLPVGNSRILSQREIGNFDLMSIPTNSDTGYIIECNLKYPKNSHNLHSDYPLVPEHLTVLSNKLNDFCNETKGSSKKTNSQFTRQNQIHMPLSKSPILH